MAMETNDKRSLSASKKVDGLTSTFVEGDINVIDSADIKKVHDPEKDFKKKLDNETSQILRVAAAVSTKDNPTLPCLTFRFWVLSSLFTSLGAALSEFYYFRPNGGTFSMFFVLLVSYILGVWMEKVLPTRTFKFKNWKFSLNPGPFNVKEHVCIFVAAGAGGGSAYATDIIAIKDLFYNTKVNFLNGFLLLMSTQILGYGLAGFLRKFLVRPANMIWPSNLVYASMYNTLHGNISETRDKIQFFVTAFTAMFVWQFVPQYMFTWLTSMALLCLFAPYSKIIKHLGSGYHGVGILNFSLDWNSIGQFGPLYTPWWAQLNFYLGVIIGAWIIAPLAYYYNVFNAQNFPFLATHSLDKDGQRYNQSAIIDQSTGSLNVTAYENYSPVYLSVTFALSYLYSFIGLTAVISHVFLFYGKEIWQRFKASRGEEQDDIHCKLMNNYPEIPNTWYALIFTIMLIIAMILCYTTDANLPWWGLLMAISLAIGMVLPVGHYMKVPPRSMFIAQLWGTILGGLINYWVLDLIIATKRPFIDGTLSDPTGQFAGYQSQIFNTASIVWGLIGPARTFGHDSMYSILLWGFLIGVFAPVPFYLLHRKFPNARFDLVNIPLICTGLSILPGTYTNFIISGFIASFLSQYYAYRYQTRWWTKYNYVLSAAFDSAAQIATLTIFFFLNGVVKIPFPEWWGNDRISQGERCFNNE
ncbi:opt family small oligopeptide transporter [Gigaspora margarita]|uniref:Opt family small oligopeptide transporter n=1 Tax=Gigaspora margarita TaxID=4874 RepID=A0A8H3XCW7_GIGMA|nr:opt family small oligopeptide transporter [Gigaspora margarita]